MHNSCYLSSANDDRHNELKMKLSIYAGLYILFTVGILQANDPFQAIVPTLKCLKPRNITGCNDTLVNDYSRSNLSEGDDNINKADTSVFLYTRLNKNNPEFLHECGGRLPSNTNYNPNKKSVFIVAGLLAQVCILAFYREYKDQLLYRDDYNVFLIDWPWGNGGPDIYGGIVNGKVVGKQICFVIKNIIEQTGASPYTFHIIGHTLGAHVAGEAGRCLDEFGYKIRRITGLDPDGLVFNGASAKDKLDKSDAHMVDIIHTNAGNCSILDLTVGESGPSGHADFYPNGGTTQLSCYPYILISLLKGDIFRAILHLLGPFCPHYQVLEYFKASINPCGCEFVGVMCKSYEDFKAEKCRSCGENGTNCAVMGMDWEYYQRKEGEESHVYYLDTDLHCPYCISDNKKIDRQGFTNCPATLSKCPHCFNSSVSTF